MTSARKAQYYSRTGQLLRNSKKVVLVLLSDCWRLAKKVASFPFFKYHYWKSQSRTKFMTTAAPVSERSIIHFDNLKLIC